MPGRFGGAFAPGGCDHEGVPDDLAALISIDPAVCHGQPVIRGTRVLVNVVLDALAAGLTPVEIVRHYSSLTEARVRAAAAYGAWLAKQEVVPLVPGQ
jgi:uncharacterized protein (DUF433 family)